MFIEPYVSLTKGNSDVEYVATMIQQLTHLGYGGAVFVTEAYNRGIEETDKCDKTGLISCVTSTQHTALVNDEKIQKSNEFKIYTRFSFSVTKRTLFNSYNSDILNGYDLISFRPRTQELFDMACKSDFIDIIEMPIEDPLPFRANKESVDNAIKRGIMFEYSLGCTFRDRFYRRLLFSSSRLLLFYCRGNNMLLASNPSDAIELRNTDAYVAIAHIMGMTGDKAADVVYRNIVKCFEHAQKRKAKNTAFMIEE